MSEIELKSCPFCGETPVLDRGYGTYCVLHSCSAVKANYGRGKKEQVIRIWNEGRSIESELSRLRRENEQLRSVVELFAEYKELGDHNYYIVAKIKIDMAVKALGEK